MNKHQRYHTALNALIQVKRHLNVVVVGANDGKINDPIYDFIKQHADATQVMLIEPLQSIIPYLTENYSYHPSHQIVNCAIGEAGELTMYTVKESYWDQFKPGYAKDWPRYRAASGITSAVRSHLEKCLKRQGIDANEAIETIKIPCQSLVTVLEEQSWPSALDVLQVDAEGYDDVVIYHAQIAMTQPKLIFFESHNMADTHTDPLSIYLKEHGYKIYQVGGNSLAVKKSFALWYGMVMLAMHKHRDK